MITIVLLIFSNIFMTFAWYGQFTAVELKTIQEVISLTVFSFFSVLYLGEQMKWNYIAGFALLAGGAFLIFKK